MRGEYEMFSQNLEKWEETKSSIFISPARERKLWVISLQEFLEIETLVKVCSVCNVTFITLFCLYPPPSVAQVIGKCVIVIVVAHFRAKKEPCPVWRCINWFCCSNWDSVKNENLEQKQAMRIGLGLGLGCWWNYDEILLHVCSEWRLAPGSQVTNIKINYSKTIKENLDYYHLKSQKIFTHQVAEQSEACAKPTKLDRACCSPWSWKQLAEGPVHHTLGQVSYFS